jgi:single-stranded-DNA-specific exonuclease
MAVVLAHRDWHAGVLGIIAGRLADLYARPVLLISLGDDPAPGSGRSVPGFALHEALRACGEGLVSHGGHAAAAGFKIRQAHVDDFRARFCAYAALQFASGPPAPRLVLDAEVPLSAVTHGFVKELARLEPYGSQNPRPLFLAGGLEVVGAPRRVGHGERHLSFRVRQHGTTLRAIGFNLADRCEELMSASGSCCLVFTPRLNEWQGFTQVDLEVQDLQAGSRARLAEGLPDRSSHTSLTP